MLLFENIKIGDAVAVPQRSNGLSPKRPHVAYRKLTVTRITATQFTCGTVRFKKDGYMIGSTFTRALPWTVELDEQHAEQSTNQKLYDRVTEGLEALTGMHRRGEISADKQAHLAAALCLARSVD